MVQFESEDVQEWREALDAYQRRLEGLGNVNLVALDEYYRVELPKVVAKRHPEAYVTQDELMKIMEWKLSRGKWRCMKLIPCTILLSLTWSAIKGHGSLGV
jgi:hypothetical protein